MSSEPLLAAKDRVPLKGPPPLIGMVPLMEPHQWYRFSERLIITLTTREYRNQVERAGGKFVGAATPGCEVAVGPIGSNSVAALHKLPRARL
jgi:hypothetical protein